MTTLTTQRPSGRRRPSISTTSPLHGLDRSLGQGGDGPEVGEVLVGAGEVEEQVADGEDAEAVQLFEAVVADAAQGVDALAQWVGLGRTGRVGGHGTFSRPGKTDGCTVFICK